MNVRVCKRTKWWQTTLPLTNSSKFLSSAVWAAQALWSLPPTWTPESCPDISAGSLDIRYLEDFSLCLNDLPALDLEDSKPRRLSSLKALYLEEFLCGRLSYLECPLPWQFSSLYLEHCMSTMLSSSLSKRLCVLKALYTEGSLSRRPCILMN